MSGVRGKAPAALSVSDITYNVSVERTSGPTVYTIGHSGHPIDQFLGLLALHEIEILVDVRSNPRSRWHPQFNRRALEGKLLTAGIRYLYLGKELGGHPSHDDLYGDDGRLLYDRLSSKIVRSGLNAVITEAWRAVTLLMCMEEDPAECHRHPLLARGLIERYVTVLHIRRDGSIDDGDSLPQSQSTLQLPLLEPPGEDRLWRSPRPIRKPRSARVGQQGGSQLPFTEPPL